MKRCQSNGASPAFLLVDFDLDFQYQTFGILFELRIFRKWWHMWHTLPLPSNKKSRIYHRTALCECCTPDSGLLNVNISETVRAGAKIRDLTSIGFSIPNRKALTVNVVLRDVDLNFQGHKFEMSNSRIRWELAQTRV